MLSPTLSVLLPLGLVLSPFTTAQVPYYDGDPNFLFIGNSYTAQNQLVDRHFTGILQDRFPEWADTAQIDSVQPGGRSLDGHLSAALAKNDVAGRNLAQWLVNDDPQYWKWVTLQDQSQVPAFNEWDYEGTAYYSSKQGAIQLNEYIKAAGGQTLFYMTWGRFDGDRNNPDLFPDYSTMQEMLIKGYLGYRDATSTPDRPTYIAPVGMVFQNIHDDLVDQGIRPQDEGTLFADLYISDGSHPDGDGTYVAALTIFTTMFGLDPTECNWFPSTIDEARGRLLQQYVKRTILETYESGFLEYPWDAPWTTTTSSSSSSSQAQGTDSPTVPVVPSESPTIIPTAHPTATTNIPTTPAPTETDATPIPTRLPNSPAPTALSAESLPGFITIEIQYDNYPEDIAWAFLKKQSDGTIQSLFFQPFNTITEPGQLQVMNFTDLPQDGSTYMFKIRDENGDGLCCIHDIKGYVKIYDQNNFGRSMQLFNLASKLETYYEVDLTIGSYGQASIEHQTSEYTVGSWPELETVLWKPVYDEVEWPGKFPNKTKFGAVVNVDLDNRPAQVSWELHKGTTNETEQTDDDPSNDWSLVVSWQGTSDMAQKLNSTEVSLQRGWYRLVVMDSAGNGLCCTGTVTSDNAQRNGYITLTGTLAATQAPGLIWGNNGNFGDKVEVHFRMEKTGYISHVRWDKSGPRTVQPSAVPTVAPTVSSVPTETPSPTAEFGDRSKLEKTEPPVVKALPPGGFNITSDTIGPTTTIAPTESLEEVPADEEVPAATETPAASSSGSSVRRAPLVFALVAVSSLMLLQ